MSDESGVEVNEGSGHTIVSNAIQMTTGDPNWNCFDMPLAASSYDVNDYDDHFLAASSSCLLEHICVRLDVQRAKL